jgi:hypothetical protein
MERPMISTYELDDQSEEQLVYREMNDEEFEDYQQRVAEAEEREKNPDPHPLIAQVNEMSEEDRAALREALGSNG